MQNLRRISLFFVLLFVTSSIVVDWDGFAIHAIHRSVESNVLADAYEDHNIQISHLTSKNSVVKVFKRRMWIDDYFEKFSFHHLKILVNSDCPFIDVRCAVKSFLHLLQLY